MRVNRLSFMYISARNKRNKSDTTTTITPPPPHTHIHTKGGEEALAKKKKIVKTHKEIGNKIVQVFYIKK